jgi:hypothetical protein
MAKLKFRRIAELTLRRLRKYSKVGRIDMNEMEKMNGRQRNDSKQ